jgi:glycosyltransferase involved in cell wall biosynthesis
VVDGVSGVVLSPGDVDGLARGILRLLENPQEASRLGNHAWQRYNAHHTPATMARRIEEVFERAYARPRFGSRRH